MDWGSSIYFRKIERLKLDGLRPSMSTFGAQFIYKFHKDWSRNMIQGKIYFEVDNNYTQIYQADGFILDILTKEASYPTETAVRLGTLENPEAYQNLQRNNPDKGNSWNGWVGLLRRPKYKPPWFPTGLLSKLTRICKKYNYLPQIQDNRIRPDENVPEFICDQKVVVDRDYQLECVEQILAKGHGVIDLPPRSGKTRIMVEAVRKINLNTIWIVPTDRIARQTVSVLLKFLENNYARHLIGSGELPSACNMRVIVCTASTASRLDADFYWTRQVLVVDEFHHAASKTYTKDIFPKCGHIYYRLGMTGTFFRSNYDAMAMHSLLSETIFKRDSKFMMDRGYLVPTKVVFLPIPKNPMLRGVSTNFVTGHGKYGIHEHKARNQLVAWAAVTLHQLGRKPMILVGTKKQGYSIKNLIAAFFPDKESGCQFESVEFISTDKPRPRQSDILDSFLSGQEVKILLGTSLLGEGVDLPDVDALVYARGEKAAVSLKQNAYRVCTAVSGKKTALIVDFADRHHRKLLRHSHERLDLYYEEATFTVEVLPDASYFGQWIQAWIDQEKQFQF